MLEDELRIGVGAYQPRHRLDLLVPDAELVHKPAVAQQARSVDVAFSKGEARVRFELERAVDAAYEREGQERLEIGRRPGRLAGAPSPRSTEPAVSLRDLAAEARLGR